MPIFRLTAKAVEDLESIGRFTENNRKYHVGRHLVFYREGDKYIEIIHVLHDSMDIERLF